MTTTRSLLALTIAILGALGSIGCPRDRDPSTTPAPEAANEITFARGGIAVGATWVRKETMETEASALVSTLDGGAPIHGEEVHALDTNERRVEVLAVVAGRPTKIKVTYLQHSHATVEGREKHEVTSVVANKTYVVERKGLDLSVRDEAGTVASQPEVELVRLDFAHFGEADPFVDALPRRPIKSGDVVEPMAIVLRERAVKDGLEVKKASVRLLDVRQLARGRAGAFEYEVETQARREGETRRTRLKGVQVLRASDSVDTEENAEGETVSERTIDFNGALTSRRDVARFKYRATSLWP